MCKWHASSCQPASSVVSLAQLLLDSIAAPAAAYGYAAVGSDAGSSTRWPSQAPGGLTAAGTPSSRHMCCAAPAAAAPAGHHTAHVALGALQLLLLSWPAVIPGRCVGGTNRAMQCRTMIILSAIFDLRAGGMMSCAVYNGGEQLATGSLKRWRVLSMSGRALARPA